MDPREGLRLQRARGRASAGLQLQPPWLQSSPHKHSTRGSCAGVRSRDLLAAAYGMAVPWRREVRSALGHLSLGKRCRKDNLLGLPTIRKRP